MMPQDHSATLCSTGRGPPLSWHLHQGCSNTVEMRLGSIFNSTFLIKRSSFLRWVFPLHITTENIFLFLSLHKSPMKSRHSHPEQMCRSHSGLAWQRQVAGQVSQCRTGPGGWTGCLSSAPAALHQTARWQGGASPGDPCFLSLCRLSSLLPHSSPEGPIPFLGVRAPGSSLAWALGPSGRRRNDSTSTVSTLHLPWFREGHHLARPSSSCPPHS